MVQLANCERCSKVFQKRLSPLCPGCLQWEEEQIRTLYRHLQQSAGDGGVLVEELADHVELTVEEIETLYLEGRLGTATAFLKTQCQNCGMVMVEIQRRGRFCINCSEKTAEAAGVQVQSSQKLDDREKQRAKQEAFMKQQQLIAQQKPKQQNEQSTIRFGMRRIGQ